MIIKNSNYFYHQSDDFKNKEDIEIPEEDIEIEDESLKTFILCCQNESFQLTDSNVFPLYQLSIKYEVPGLLQLAQDYIKQNNQNLCIKSIIFKIQQKPPLNDTKAEEESVSYNFFNFIDNDSLISLPMPILYRIMNSEIVQSELKKSDEKRAKTTEFLFKCLDLRKREASVLFLNFDIENQRIDLLKRLIDDYSEIFDFSMINPKYLLSTTTQLLSEVTKLKHNYSEKIDELNRIVESQKAVLNEQKSSQTDVKNFVVENLKREKMELVTQIEDLKNKDNQKISELETRISQQEAVIQKLKSDLESSFDSKFSDQRSKNDQIFKSLNDLKLKLESIQKQQNESTVSFEYNGNCFNGIFNFLRNNSKIADEVEVTRSSNGGGIQPLMLFNYEVTNGGLCTGSEKNPWICFKLKRHRVVPTSYTIRESDGGKDHYHLRSWQLQGSKDGGPWETIDTQTDCPLLNDEYACHTFRIGAQSQREFTWFRIYETGPTWRKNNSNNYMDISAFELFGNLL